MNRIIPAVLKTPKAKSLYQQSSTKAKTKLAFLSFPQKSVEKVWNALGTNETLGCVDIYTDKNLLTCYQCVLKKREVYICSNNCTSWIHVVKNFNSCINDVSYATIGSKK